MPLHSIDVQPMRRAIDVARRNPSAPFGTVLVEAETLAVVCEGVNDAQSNPMLHGEIDAIFRCASQRHRVDWSSLWLYTTAEPCCMCQGAILWAGIRRVCFGTSIATLRTLGWRQIEIPATEVVNRMPEATCEVLGGVLEQECDTLFRATGKRKVKPNHS
jgi:tRNA(Arg) A34 adenosine deaminase TadA